MTETNKETVVETENIQQPKKETRQEKVAKKFAKFANVKDLRGNAEFNNLATETLNQEFSLADGGNPSAKYLRQNIIAKHVPESITRFCNELLGVIEFIDTGKGAEYILTMLGVVNSMDPNAFVPTEVYDMGKATYVDTIDLPAVGSRETKSMERSVQLYKYLPYYLSGKADEVSKLIIEHMDDSMVLSIFQDLLAIISRMYAVVAAKVSGVANYLEGSATSVVDAMKELKDFVTPMLSHNVKYNWGNDDGSTHSDFTDAAYFAQSTELRFVTDYRTFNNIKKVLPTIYHDDKLAEGLLGNLSNWVVVPTSYLAVNDLASPSNDDPSINDKPTLVENYSLFTKTVQGVATRQLGTIMIIQKNDIKAAYNFEQKESEYFPKNCVTQVFRKKNLKLKALKWTQVAVYQNAHLEDEFSIPVTTESVKA